MPPRDQRLEAQIGMYDSRSATHSGRASPDAAAARQLRRKRWPFRGRERSGSRATSRGSQHRVVPCVGRDKAPDTLSRGAVTVGCALGDQKAPPTNPMESSKEAQYDTPKLLAEEW